MDLAKLKALLGIEDDSKDMVLEFVIADVEEIIKNYCHVEEMPDGLTNTGYRMAMDLYRNENIGSESAAVGAVSSISEGDTSTSFRFRLSYFSFIILMTSSRNLHFSSGFSLQLSVL